LPKFYICCMNNVHLFSFKHLWTQSFEFVAFYYVFFILHFSLANFYSFGYFAYCKCFFPLYRFVVSFSFQVIFISLHFTFFHLRFYSFSFSFHVLPFHCHFFVLILLNLFFTILYDEVIDICVVDPFYTSFSTILLMFDHVCYDVEPNFQFPIPKDKIVFQTMLNSLMFH
jgi:hypothetical protein